MAKPMRKKPAGTEKKLKKKTSILTAEKVVWVDYKDANLLRRFMSDRAKIRARRVTGNDQQQQAAVAKAIKLSREMALLPYSVRQVQQRTKGRGGRDRRDADLQLETELPSEVAAAAAAAAEAELLAASEVSDGVLDDVAVVEIDTAEELAEVPAGSDDQ